MRIYTDREMVEYNDGGFDVLDELFWNLDKKEGLKMLEIFNEVSSEIPKDILVTMEGIIEGDDVPEEKIIEYKNFDIEKYDKELKEKLIGCVKSINLTEERIKLFSIGSFYNYFEKFLKGKFLIDKDIKLAKDLTGSKVFDLENLELSFKGSILEDFIDDWKKISPSQVRGILELDYEFDDEKKVFKEKGQKWIDNRKELLFKTYIYSKFPDGINENQKELLANPEKLKELQIFMKNFFEREENY